MDVVIDSNVLFRTLISRGEILKLLFDINLQMFAPLKLKEEFLEHKPEILSKSKLSSEEFETFSMLILERITFIPSEEFDSYIVKAKELLGKHSKDEDFVALCLSKSLKFWTYEKLLFDLGFGISTKQISESLSDLA